MLDVSFQGPALGDLICTTGDCNVGKLLVDTMNQVYNAAVASLPDSTDFVSKFGTTVSSISADYDSNNTWTTNWIPFATGCCTIKVIGGQAQDVTTQMRTYLGQAQTGNIQLPGPTSNIDIGGFLDTILTTGKWLLIIGAVGVLGYGAFRGYESIKHSREPKK